jgi:cytidylate kinase
VIITIDGPSGTGKTTVAKRVAEALSFSHFDTGAMYRCATWFILKHQIPLSEIEKLKERLAAFSFHVEERDGTKHYFVEGEDVTAEIRSQRITKEVSAVAALPFIREILSRTQKEFAIKESAVFEGRDLGSVIFPHAEVKIFLTASSQVRAVRRLKEIRATRPDEAKQIDLATLAADMEQRDLLDSTRKIAPLKQPEGAYVVDTSTLSIDQVVDLILKRVKKTLKKMSRSWLFAKKMKPFYRFILCLAWILYKILYRHKVYGLEHYYAGPGILAANHTSYLDPPIVAISWPEEVHFLAKESLFKPFLFGRMIRALNSHPVSGEVNDISVFKTLIQLLKEGKKVILFPEGLRSENGQLEPLKAGIGLLAARANAAIIPTYIFGAYQIWDIHHKLPKFTGRTVCIFGKPILWQDFSSFEKKEAQAQLLERLTDAILKLKHWYESGAKGIPP